MKIERVNENQIRCTLNKDDLASRQLKISELAYGSDKAKELFRDMMQQASYEVGFEAEDIPLMIEAIPISADCIVLIVTKVENPEELDTRFSKFSPSDDGEYDYDDEYSDMETIDDSSSYTDSSVPPTAGDELDIDTKQTKSEGGVIGDDLMNLFSKVREYLNNTNKTPDNTTLPSKNTDEPADKEEAKNAKPVIKTRIYSFESMDDFLMPQELLLLYITILIHYIKSQVQIDIILFLRKRAAHQLTLTKYVTYFPNMLLKNPSLRILPLTLMNMANLLSAGMP